MINNAYLLGLFGGDASMMGGLTPPVIPPKKSQPTAPWAEATKPTEPSALIRAALAGRRIINESAVDLDVTGTSSGDYTKMFALYQGLDTLLALANRTTEKGLSKLETDQLARRFTSGLGELSAWFDKTTLEDIRLVQGAAAASVKSTGGVPKGNPQLVTKAVHEGALSAPVAAFEGDVQFSISLTSLVGTKTVDIDLTEMGATPRTLDAVVAHINDKLQTAGAEARFGREMLVAEPRTVKAGDKTITLPPGPDQWALTVRANPTETVSFSAPKTADAVYVVQGVGGGAHELLKFQDGEGDGVAPPTAGGVGESWWVDGRASQTGLPPGVETVRASAIGPDGSLWMVADLTEGSDNRPIKGERDVALMKFDSSGRLLATRSLGAASTASGYAIAIDDDGRVAVAGSVTGALEPGQSGKDATVADSFVTVFDAEAKEVWTQRRGAAAADEATAVSFGANGEVIVAGRAKSGMPGQLAKGGWDGYLQTFTESQVHSLAPIVASPGVSTQFGTAGDDGVDAMVVDGQNIYTAGVENGRAIVRQYGPGADGALTLMGTRDLGYIAGEIAGLSISNGQVVLAGTTSNPGLSAGTVTTPYSGGTDAFVAVLSSDLQAAATDRLTYYGGVNADGVGGDDTVADVKMQDGKVWITGVSNRPVGAKDEDPTSAYLTRLDPLTGAVEWSRTWQGDGEQAAPATLAVAPGGASVLDRLGLPQGELVMTDSKLLTAATSVRTGDRFYITPASGGRSIAVTIEAKDTLQTLARKIEMASQSTLKVTVSSTKGTMGGAGYMDIIQQLSITSKPGRDGAVISAGEAGRDALAGLGLSAGFVGPVTGDDVVKAFGLDLPKTLNLSSQDGILAAKDRLIAAMKTVREAYGGLNPEASKPKPTGPVPPYLAAQLANYQAALARLTGG